MRKYIKNSVLEIFQTMYDAHGRIKKLIDKKDFENVQSLLAECQNTAVEIGSIIENSEGEGFVTVGYLEEYCEALYQVAISLSDDYIGIKAKKTLDKVLAKAEYSVKSDIKVRLEIVFCPYKASMWDSLESVWKAADEDPDCDAYVVPIPYFDRKSDHSFGEFHYEGGDYPSYVPITHYDAYDFEARKPDVIYIHNPYDDCNYVTSVDPRFYSSELKKYTDELVYIPYCVYDEPKSSTDKDTLAYFKRYITPVLFNANQIIFQSENFSKTFLKMISSNMNVDISKKVLSLGSPKYDKVKNTIPEIDIEESWKNIIFSDSGKKKKVVFYNTSIGMMLANGEKMISKIKSVIAYFEEHKNEYILLWRPHPLIEATIASMLPHLSKDYNCIVEEFKKKNIGIYDDTPDYNAGFSVSDAYYGDFSSLVQLYQATGKLLMTQNTDITYYCNTLDYVISNNMYYDGEYIWATALYYNALFRINPKTFIAEYIGSFPNEDINGYNLYYGIEEKNGKLYFCPSNAGSIGMLDKMTLKLSGVKVMTQNNPQNGNYFGICSLEDNIIIAGYRNNIIAMMDTKTHEVKYINPCEFFCHKVFDESDLLVRHLCKFNGKLYTVSKTQKALLKFDPLSKSGEFIHLPDDIIDSEKLVYSFLYSDGLSLWLIQSGQENLLRIDPLTGNVLQNINYAKAAKFAIIGQFVYLFSSETTVCLQIKIGTYEITEIDIGVKTNYVYNFDEKIIIINSLEKDIYILNTKTFECSNIPISIHSENTDTEQYSITGMFKSYEKQLGFVRESSFYNLELLMEGIDSDSAQTTSESNEPIGELIHKTIKEKTL